jgi:peptidoglycan/LPS O-acetylase OafA/YrhL
VLLGAAAALTALVGFVFPVLGVGPLNQASQVLGVVRGALGFFLGFLARFAFERLPAHPAYGGALALVGGLAAGWAALSGAPLVMVSLGACGLVAGFAALDRAGLRNPLTLAPMQHLGRWSYAMFVLHVPLFIIMTREMDKLGWDGQLSLGLGAAMMLLVIALSAPAHLLVEEPARRAIRAFGTGKRPFRTLIARRLRTSQA